MICVNKVKIYLQTTNDVIKFINFLNTSGVTENYILESETGKYRVDACSFLGVMYFTTEHRDDTYLIDITGADLPEGVQQFKA